MDKCIERPYEVLVEVYFFQERSENRENPFSFLFCLE